jgi:hypothetical protein
MQAERAKNEQFLLLTPRVTARRSHSWICPMVYILKGKVSWLLLMAIIWTISSDAALQACSKVAARWGNAQAVTRANDFEHYEELASCKISAAGESK